MLFLGRQTIQEFIAPTTSAESSTIAFEGSNRGHIKLTVPNGTVIAQGSVLLGNGESFTIQYDSNHAQAIKLVNGNTQNLAMLPNYKPIWVDCPQYIITNITNQFMDVVLDIGNSYRIRKTATAQAIGVIAVTDNSSFTQE